MTTATDTLKRYYLQFKKADGTWEIVGPYLRKARAMMVYKKMYLAEYGVPCPHPFFKPTENDNNERPSVGVKVETLDADQMAAMNWDKARKPKPSLNNGSPWNTNVYKGDTAARKAAADAKAIQTVKAKILASSPHLTDAEAFQRAEAWLTAKRKKDAQACSGAVH